MAYFHLGRGVVLPTLTVTLDDIDYTVENKTYLWVLTSNGWDKWEDPVSVGGSYHREFASAEEAYSTWDMPVHAKAVRVCVDHSQTINTANTDAKRFEAYFYLRAAHGYDYGAQYRVFSVNTSDANSYHITTTGGGSNSSIYTSAPYINPFGVMLYMRIATAGVDVTSFALHATPMLLED